MASLRQQQQASAAWFMSLIKGVRGSAGLRRRLNIAYFDPAKDVFTGQMYFFVYDAKLKETLPYWDKYPVVIPLGFYDDGFLGLNLHYLPPKIRQAVLEKLIKYKKLAGSPRAYMRLSYPLLQGILQDRLLQPMIHRYLTKQIRSNFIKIYEGAWDNAVMLPVQKFQGASSQTVWSHAR